MNEESQTGPRKIPEEELKFGLSLRLELLAAPDKPINVIVVGEEGTADETLLEVATEALPDIATTGALGGTMLAGTVYPPGMREKLASVAAHDTVKAIIYDEPLMPPTPIPRSYFR